jgi:hypothetical protein
MNWKELANDLVLFEQITQRFKDIGCNEDDAVTLTTHLYTTNQPIVIRTSTNSDDNNTNNNR